MRVTAGHGSPQVAEGKCVPQIKRLGAGFVVACLLMVVTATSALADGYVLGGHVSTLPLDPSNFSSPSGVAINQSNQSVFVVDTGNGRVVQLDSTGTTATSFTAAGAPNPETASLSAIASDDSSGDVYVVDTGNSAVDRFNPDGTFVGRLDPALVPGGTLTPTAVATDSSNGDVYVVNSAVPAVDVFASDGSFKLRIDGAGSAGPLTSPSAVAVNDGDVYVVDAGSVSQFDTAGTFVSVLIPNGGLQAIAVDNATGNLFVHSAFAGIQQYDPAGTLLASFGSSDVFFSFGLAFDSTANRVWAADQFSDVAFFDPATPPDVATLAATNVTRNRATLNATIDPNKSPTTYYFEYGPTIAYGSQVPIAPADAGSGDEPATRSVDLNGIDPAAQYHFRVVADNGTGGPQMGGDQTFTTLPPLADIALQPVTGITQNGATLHATVDNHGFASSYQFSVSGTNNGHQSSTAPVDLPAVDGPQSVTATVGDLPTGGSFQVRVFATTGGGTAFSDFVDFQTVGTNFVPGPPPPADVNPYGCGAPRLNAYARKPRAGSTITLTGSDLGVGGTVTFGSAEADVDTWSATAIKLRVPSGTGKRQVKVNCLRDSNAISVTVAKAKKKAVKCKRGFVKKKVKGKTKCVKKKAAKPRKRR
jgi:IPT/TIG domain/NHL repeat